MRSILRKLVRLVNKEEEPFVPYAERLRRKGYKIGKDCFIGVGSNIDETQHWLITIGDSVTISRDVLILAHDATMKMHLGYTRLAKVVVEDHVFIGAKSVILPGVRIGRNSIVGAGSVVTRDVPSGTVVAGNPAKVINTLEKFLEKRKKEMDASPKFGPEYLEMGENPTQKMKDDMVEKMGDGTGYVI